jgi:hypothetical protein
MIPTLNTAAAAASTVQNKMASIKDGQESAEAALLDWEALRCEFQTIQAANPRPAIEAHLFPEENHQFLGTKKRLYKRLRWLVHWLVRPSVPISLRKLVTLRLLREEEEEEENWLRRYSFAPRD